MPYTPQCALELLDRLTIERVVEPTDIVRGTIALALHASPSDVASGEDVVPLLADLEALLLGQIVGFDQESVERTVRVAAGLRRVVGVH